MDLLLINHANRVRLDPQPLSTPPGVWAGNPVWQGLYTFRSAGCQAAGSGVDTLYALGTCQDLVSGRAVRHSYRVWLGCAWSLCTYRFHFNSRTPIQVECDLSFERVSAIVDVSTHTLQVECDDIRTGLQNWYGEFQLTHSKWSVTGAIRYWVSLA